MSVHKLRFHADRKFNPWVYEVDSPIFYTLPHDSGRVLWYHVGCLSVCRTWSVRPYFRFWMITWVNVNRFSPNSVCALILWRSGVGLLMGKFRQFLTELPARDTSVFLFPDENFSKYQWIFTKDTWCVHWYCGDLVWDWWWANLVNFWQSYLPATRS